MKKNIGLVQGLAALFTSVLIVQNHPQIDYYLFLAIAIMTIFYAVSWIKNKEWRHFGLAVAFTVIAGLTGVLTNAVSIFSTYEYQKETIRGGARALVDSTAKNENAKDGLTKDYALSYSMDIPEPFIMMVPRMYGGSSDHMEVKEERFKSNGKLKRSSTMKLSNKVSRFIEFLLGWNGEARMNMEFQALPMLALLFVYWPYSQCLYLMENINGGY